jgi:hypothetical protein
MFCTSPVFSQGCYRRGERVHGRMQVFHVGIHELLPFVHRIHLAHQHLRGEREGRERERERERDRERETERERKRGEKDIYIYIHLYIYIYREREREREREIELKWLYHNGTFQTF